MAPALDPVNSAYRNSQRETKKKNVEALLTPTLGRLPSDINR